jgi:hypothetical protein
MPFHRGVQPLAAAHMLRLCMVARKRGQHRARAPPQLPSQNLKAHTTLLPPLLQTLQQHGRLKEKSNLARPKPEP